MQREIARLIAALCVLLLFGCSRPGSEMPAEPQAADDHEAMEDTMRGPDVGEMGGVDPTVADPGHYTAEFENDAVRILRIKYGPGDESILHYHPRSVAVFLTDANSRMTMGDGSSADVSVPAGTVIFNEPGEHQPKNIGDTPWEVVEVELKGSGSGGEAAGGPDPTVVDPDHYTTEFENDAVRVVRISYGPGETSVMHNHPDGVAVFLTDQLVEMTSPDGSSMEMPASAGEAMFVPGGQHLPRNLSDSALELVLIELK